MNLPHPFEVVSQRFFDILFREMTKNADWAVVTGFNHDLYHHRFVDTGTHRQNFVFHRLLIDVCGNNHSVQVDAKQRLFHEGKCFGKAFDMFMGVMEVVDHADILAALTPQLFLNSN